MRLRFFTDRKRIQLAVFVRGSVCDRVGNRIRTERQATHHIRRPACLIDLGKAEAIWRDVVGPVVGGLPVAPLPPPAVSRPTPADPAELLLALAAVNGRDAIGT